MAIAKKKKKFWDVNMPILRKETQLYSFTIEELAGRIIKYDLTRMLRGKNAVLMLDVIATKDNATTYPREFRILPTFMKKMVRKGTSYVEDSFDAETKDAIVTIKPFLIARRKVSRAVRKALREKAREEIKKEIKKETTEELFQEIIRNQFQKPLSLKLKKTYPLSLCEIRIIKVKKKLGKKEKKPTEEKPEEAKKEKKTEPEKDPVKEEKTEKKPKKEKIKKKVEKKTEKKVDSKKE